MGPGLVVLQLPGDHRVQPGQRSMGADRQCWHRLKPVGNAEPQAHPDLLVQVGLITRSPVIGVHTTACRAARGHPENTKSVS